jgi:hypothetical protein
MLGVRAARQAVFIDTKAAFDFIRVKAAELGGELV